MSQQAILDTIQLEMNQAALRAGSPKRLILAPGNYGLDYLHERYPGFHAVPVVKTSNFIGDTLDMAAAARFEEVLLVGFPHRNIDGNMGIRQSLCVLFRHETRTIRQCSNRQGVFLHCPNHYKSDLNFQEKKKMSGEHGAECSYNILDCPHEL